MTSSALLLSDDAELIQKIGTVFEFIEYSLCCSGCRTDQITRALDQDAQHVIAILPEMADGNEAEILALINRLRPSLPVYVHTHDL